jgi:hypothetical protein
MKKLLLILLCLPFIGFGQVNIPDANFKAYLVGNTAINTNGDTVIQVSEANSFSGGILCNSMNISDLTGIEEFDSLNYLYCYNNQLTSLDVSNLSFLIELSCGNNQLPSLDVSTNTALEFLSCSNNQLTSLDISNCVDLIELFCHINQLSSLNLTTNTSLNSLMCSYNQITTLDLSYNSNLNKLYCGNNQLVSLDLRNGNNLNWSWYLQYEFVCVDNPSLSCIDVDDEIWSTSNITVANGNIDAQHYFSNNCSGATGIEEHTTNKELLKVTDLLGRETKQTNQPLFYIYDDGTVEKRIVIE